jgi:hypothetical protein
MTELERLDHAEAVHGLQAKTCPACAGSARGCRTCNEHGLVWNLDRTPCGRADCPIGRGAA